MFLNRESIVATDVSRTDTVQAFGGTVLCRNVSSREQEHWWTILDDWNTKGVYAPAGKRGSLVMMGAINPDGSPLFTLADATWLGSNKADKDSIEAIFKKIQELSGMTEAAQVDAEKKPETPTKSSGDGPPTNGVDQT